MIALVIHLGQASWLLLALAGADLLIRAGRWLGVKVKAWMLDRTKSRTDALKPLMGKLVRHARTGRVGLCAGIGEVKHPRWGGYRPRVALMVCFCAKCNRRMLAAEESDNLVMRIATHAAAMQCMEFPPADECTVAPAADAARFRESLAKNEPEGFEP